MKKPIHKQRIKDEWHIVKRNGKLFKIKYWDNLSYDEYRIVSSKYICLFGIDELPLFKRKNYLKRVIKAGLQDYVFGEEIKK